MSTSDNPRPVPAWCGKTTGTEYDNLKPKTATEHANGTSETPRTHALFSALADAVGQFVNGKIYGSDLVVYFAQTEKECRQLERELAAAKFLLDRTARNGGSMTNATLAEARGIAGVALTEPAPAPASPEGLREAVERVLEQYGMLQCPTSKPDILDSILAAIAPFVGDRLQWHDGPARGGDGTAGKDAKGIPQWWDGDRLLIIVELSDGDEEIAIVDISADEDSFSVTDATTGDAYDEWGPECWSWWAKFTSKNLPNRAARSAQPATGKGALSEKFSIQFLTASGWKIDSEIESEGLAIARFDAIGKANTWSGHVRIMHGCRVIKSTLNSPTP